MRLKRLQPEVVACLAPGRVGDRTALPERSDGREHPLVGRAVLGGDGDSPPALDQFLHRAEVEVGARAVHGVAVVALELGATLPGQRGPHASWCARRPARLTLVGFSGHGSRVVPTSTPAGLEPGSADPSDRQTSEPPGGPRDRGTDPTR